MAEAIGGVASVLTILSAVDRVIRCVQSCKNASIEKNRLIQEFSYVRGLLETLKTTLQDADPIDYTWTATVAELNHQDGLIHQFQQLLDLIDISLGKPSQSKGLKKLRVSVQWPYKEAETMKLVATVERYKNLFGLALQNSHISLAHAIRKSAASLHTDVRDVMDSVARSTRHLEALTNKGKDLEYRQLFDWVSKWNFWGRQSDILSQRVDKTGDWILAAPEFQDWKSKNSRTLLCVGAPGVGKTVLAAIVVEHLTTTLPKGSCVFAFYCSQLGDMREKYQTVLRALVQQLLRMQKTFVRVVKDLHDRHTHGTAPDSTELLASLREGLMGLDKVYFVIDALDEWSSHPQPIKSLLDDLRSLGDNVNILAMSRPIGQLQETVTAARVIEVHLPVGDLRMYIRFRLSDSDQQFLTTDIQLKAKVEQTVLESCEGLFLMARLQMDELLRQRHKRGLLHTVTNLPRTPDTLYDAALGQVLRQTREDVMLAMRVFAWLYFAHEPLSIALVQYALAIQPGDTVVDQDGSVDETFLISLCGGLVVLDRQSQLLRFVHPTTRYYFEQYFRKQSETEETKEIELGSTCLTFFLSTTCKQLARPGHSLSSLSVPYANGLDPGLTWGHRTHLFLEYASKHVISHYRATGECETLFHIMQKLFCDNDALTLLWKARLKWSAIRCGWHLDTISDSDKLCIASYLGLTQVVSWLLDSGASPNAQDTTGQTPLYAAASQDEAEIIKILLRKGAIPDAPSFHDPSSFKVDSNRQRFCLTPMHCALSRGNLPIAQMLLDHGVKLEPATFSMVQPPQQVTPLRIALQSKSSSTVEFVLRYRPQDLHEHQDLYNDPVLYEAIDMGAVDVLRVLLKAGANVHLTNRRDLSLIEAALNSPIWRVSGEKCRDICRLILEHTPIRSWSLRLHNCSALMKVQPAGWRPETVKYLKVVGFWVSSRGYGNRRRSI